MTEKLNIHISPSLHLFASSRSKFPSCSRTTRDILDISHYLIPLTTNVNFSWHYCGDFPLQMSTKVGNITQHVLYQTASNTWAHSNHKAGFYSMHKHAVICTVWGLGRLMIALQLPLILAWHQPLSLSRPLLSNQYSAPFRPTLQRLEGLQQSHQCPLQQPWYYAQVSARDCVNYSRNPCSTFVKSALFHLFIFLLGIKHHYNWNGGVLFPRNEAFFTA